MNLYREKILDHYRYPQNQGEIKDPDCRAHVDNPLCGDEIEVVIKLNKDIIKDIKFKAEGCAISIASMSLLSEKIKKESVKILSRISEKEIQKMLGVELSTSRIKCALLGLNALKTCLEKRAIHSSLRKRTLRKRTLRK